MKNTHNFTMNIALAVVVILGLVTTADAALLTYSDTYGPTSVGSAAGWAGASLTKFDPTLGTLTKVTLILDSDTYAGLIGWDNEAGTASDVTLGIGAQVTITALGTLVTTAVPLQTGSSSVTADTDVDADYAGTDAFWLMGGVGSDSNSNSTTNPLDLALFTGLGSFDVWLSTTVSTYLSTLGGYGPIVPVPGQTDGIITVMYEYTPVPEPATMVLLGLGGAFLVRNKRKR